ncbi:MAG: thiamine diphosphokinase [Bacteroidaceae bacterium]|nr:thiamine diphosphokinase [Bacteroidaceae bacterium]
MNLPQFEAVIIANGEYPHAEEPLKILRNAPFVVCCDGGADEYIAQGFTPDIIIGDGDSLSEENRNKFAHLILQIKEQETNDQTKAVNYLIGKGCKRIAIMGATGKREDHTLGNISLLIEYARKGITVNSFTNYGVFIPCQGRNTFPSRKGLQISIINFTARGFKSEGLLYPIYDFTNWWQGTLNECTGESFTIEAEGEYMLFMNYPR